MKYGANLSFNNGQSALKQDRSLSSTTKVGQVSENAALPINRKMI